MICVVQFAYVQVVRLYTECFRIRFYLIPIMGESILPALTGQLSPVTIVMQFNAKLDIL